MDQAVALVETCLQINGYFTVTEYPMIEDYYLDEHWEILRTAQFKHPALDSFMVLKTIRQNIGSPQPDSSNVQS